MEGYNNDVLMEDYNNDVVVYTNGYFDENLKDEPLSFFGFVAYKNNEVEIVRNYGEVLSPCFLELGEIGAEMMAILAAMEWAEANRYTRLIFKSNSSISTYIFNERLSMFEKKMGLSLFHEKIKGFFNRGLIPELELIDSKTDGLNAINIDKGDFEKYKVAYNLSRTLILENLGEVVVGNNIIVDDNVIVDDDTL